MHIRLILIIVQDLVSSYALRFHAHTLSCVNPQIINARSSRALTLGELLFIKVIQIGLLGQRFKVSYI